MFTRTLIRPVVLAKSYGIARRLRGSFRKKRLINALQNHVTEPVFWGWGTEREEREKALDTAVWCCQGRYRNVSLHLTLLHLSSPATAAHPCFSYINKNILGPTSGICFDF